MFLSWSFNFDFTLVDTKGSLQVNRGWRIVFSSIDLFEPGGSQRANACDPFLDVKGRVKYSAVAVLGVITPLLSLSVYLSPALLARSLR